ncbi:hypothetical protein BDN70DRAFT_876254 [Pholiota conissans]|uniref:Uncharacterized protein n=1 Tax=Pholiota conissans TaxID=109636 RepID=A0A9P6CW50_9AGAR|nr:hypothetical protein BDN70DRAFT_876254 [Pholiota conissans]
MSQPSSQRIPRNICRGGYVLSPELINQIASKVFDLEVESDDSPGWVYLTMNKGINKLTNGRFWAAFSPTGEVIGGDFILWTHRIFLARGYLGMPESEMPDFTEGENERQLREALASYGFSEDQYHWGKRVD